MSLTTAAATSRSRTDLNRRRLLIGAGAGVAGALLVIAAVIGAVSLQGDRGWDPPRAATGVTTDMAVADYDFGDGESSAMHEPRTARYAVRGDDGDAANSGTETEDVAAFVRQIIQRASLTVRVTEYEPARAAVDRLVENSGGYVSNASVQHSEGRPSSATLTLRVPAAGFGGVLDELRGLGQVQRESLDSDDISREYYDTQARIRNAQRMEARLIEMLEQREGDLSDVLRVETELSRVRGQIEQMQGQIRMWNSLVSLSTVRLTLNVARPYEPRREVEEHKPTFGDTVARAWWRSWSAIGRFLTMVAAGLVALVPWLPLFLAVGLTGRFAWRRMRRPGA